MPSPEELSPSPSIQERLGSMGINGAALLLPGQVAVEQMDTEAQRRQDKIDEWSAAVESIRADTATLRESLEAGLREAVSSGRITTLADAERHIADIDARVARGPERSRTYNGYDGDKWHRAQTYYATVDEQGNVWGDFEEVPPRLYAGVTGRPLSPGKHIVHRNPTLPAAPRR